jgi:hypothetical protein
MKQYYYIFICLLCILCVTSVSTSTYASNENIGRIRGNSVRQNERIYNKIAIDLVNGKSTSVSIDNMSRLIKNYNIVKFDQHVNPKTQDMIIREIAYRMIRNNYLPRVNDTINVYKQAMALSKDATPHVRQASQYPGYKASLVLPIDNARIKENKVIDTINWDEVADQASSAIESLWMERMRSSSSALAANDENGTMIAVLSELKIICDEYSGSTYEFTTDKLKGNALYNAIRSVFKSWELKGMVSKNELPVIGSLIRQYIILNSSSDTHKLARDIEGFKDVNSLHSALITRIDFISQVIKQKDPSDYAAIAMLQAMLNDISAKISIISASPENNSRFDLKQRPVRP